MPRATKAAPKKAAPAKTAKTQAKKAAPAKKAAVTAKTAGPAKKSTATPSVKKAAPAAAKKTAPAKKAAPAPVKKAPVAKKVVAPAPVKKAPVPVKKVAPAKKRPVVLDKFLLEQRDLLHEERARHVEQAQELRAEADQLAAEREPGDIQFDEESGEGGTTNIDRERDLALSMQAQTEVEEIDHALARIEAGTYGICERCGENIPKARLKAIPHARLCIACKSGGLSRR
jgi:RNA polymerase-binding transcription factor